MAGRGTGPDFVEALARGLDVLSCFDERRPRMTLSEIAAATGLARPTAGRSPTRSWRRESARSPCPYATETASCAPR